MHKPIVPFFLMIAQIMCGLAILRATAAPQVEPHKPGAKTPSAATSAGTPLERTPLVIAHAEGVTVRLLRARWAETAEVSLFRTRSKQLTLWFDATVDKGVMPPGLAPADFIINVRAYGAAKQPVQVFPIDAVKSLHRLSLPYVPGKPGIVPAGQSIWRAQPLDPRMSEVHLEIEFLLPGHPVTNKTIPPSILESAVPPAAAALAGQWLRKLSLTIPSDVIEWGRVHHVEPLAKAQAGDIETTIFPWHKSTFHVISGQGAGHSGVTFEAPLLLRALSRTKQEGLATHNWFGEMRDANGVVLPIQIREALDLNSFWRPDGKPLADTEAAAFARLEFDTTPALPDALRAKLPDPDSQWSLRLRHLSNMTREVEMVWSGTTPAKGEAQAVNQAFKQVNNGQSQSSQVRLRFWGAYDETHPLQKLAWGESGMETAPTRPPSGLLLITQAESSDGMPYAWKLASASPGTGATAALWKADLSAMQAATLQKNWPLAEVDKTSTPSPVAESKAAISTRWQAWIVPLPTAEATPLQLRLTFGIRLWDTTTPVIELSDLKPFAAQAPNAPA